MLNDELSREQTKQEAHLTRSALGFLTLVVDDDGSRGMKSSSAIVAIVTNDYEYKLVAAVQVEF